MIQDELSKELIAFALDYVENGGQDPREELLKKAQQAITKLFLESLPEKRLVQIGDSDCGQYPTKGEICIHGINLTSGQKLCIECANDRGFNQAINQITKRWR